MGRRFYLAVSGVICSSTKTGSYKPLSQPPTSPPVRASFVLAGLARDAVVVGSAGAVAVCSVLLEGQVMKQSSAGRLSIVIGLVLAILAALGTLTSLQSSPLGQYANVPLEVGMSFLISLVIYTVLAYLVIGIGRRLRGGR